MLPSPRSSGAPSLCSATKFRPRWAQPRWWKGLRASAPLLPPCPPPNGLHTQASGWGGAHGHRCSPTARAVTRSMARGSLGASIVWGEVLRGV